jgi:lipopolysaccharide export system permease protein
MYKCYLSDIQTEFQKRWVFAFASICFVLVGIPLGIRAQRKESSIGMAISLVVALSYYLVIMLMLSLSTNFKAQPEFLIWLPVLACALLASYLIPKNL